jgi:hypothetical protein
VNPTNLIANGGDATALFDSKGSAVSGDGGQWGVSLAA